ncbi:MAG: ABC transporter permease [Rikenellaceae bacterium]|nr:ABC transporter permease [Rikenellaceae bacterium]
MLSELSERSNNLSALATHWQSFIITPRDNDIIADGKENVLPNIFTFSAYNVYNFHVRHDSVNPLIKQAEKLSWGFIVSMFLGFITLLLAFDSISGEKEDRTLSLVFSNGVSRRTFLLGKLSSIVSIAGIMLLVGMLISLLMIVISGNVVIDSGFLIETGMFFIFSLFFITLFAALGLLSSTITAHSNISLLISLCFWLFAVVVIPNSSIFWAKKLFPIPTADQVDQVINQEQRDLINNAPRGSQSSSNDPFYPQHELRANLYMSLVNAEKRHKDHYYMRRCSISSKKPGVLR